MMAENERKLKLVGDQEFPAIYNFLYVLSFPMVPTCIVVHVAFKNFRNTQSKCNDGGKTLISYTFWYKIERRCDCDGQTDGIAHCCDNLQVQAEKD